MVVSINSSNAFTLQSGISQASSSKINIPSNKTKVENPFVRKMENSSSNLDVDASYKIELGSEKLHGTFSTLDKEASVEKNPMKRIWHSRKSTRKNIQKKWPAVPGTK